MQSRAEETDTDSLQYLDVEKVWNLKNSSGSEIN